MMMEYGVIQHIHTGREYIHMMEVRIIEETKPDCDAVQAVPTLEDDYLYLFNYLPEKSRR